MRIFIGSSFLKHAGASIAPVRQNNISFRLFSFDPFGLFKTMQGCNNYVGNTEQIALRKETHVGNMRQASKEHSGARHV
jgi:hypothetical protein